MPFQRDRARHLAPIHHANGQFGVLRKHMRVRVNDPHLYSFTLLLLLLLVLLLLLLLLPFALQKLPNGVTERGAGGGGEPPE